MHFEDVGERSPLSSISSMVMKSDAGNGPSMQQRIGPLFQSTIVKPSKQLIDLSLKDVAEKIDLMQNKDQISKATEELKEVLMNSHVQAAKFKKADNVQS